jgi:hypothetical protein
MLFDKGKCKSGEFTAAVNHYARHDLGHTEPALNWSEATVKIVYGKAKKMLAEWMAGGGPEPAKR